MHPFARRALVPGFLLTTVVTYGVSILVVGVIPETRNPELMAFAVTFDLTIVVPSLYYFILVRGRRLPLVSIAPIFLLSLAGAGLILPSQHQEFLGWAQVLAVPLEFLVLGFIGVKAYRIAAALGQNRTASGPLAGGPGEFYERLRVAARDALGSRVVGDIVATEIAMAYYAAAGWRHPSPTGSGLFSTHRRSGYAAVVCVLAAVMVIETIGIHVLVHQWSPATAWSLTFLSLYGLAWIAADLQAIRLRPNRLGPNAIDIRVGLRWRVVVRFEYLVGLYRVARRPPESNDPGYLNAVPIGSPLFYVVLRESAELEGLYGIRKRVTKIGFTVDDPEGFEAAFRDLYDAWQSRSRAGST